MWKEEGRAEEWSTVIKLASGQTQLWKIGRTHHAPQPPSCLPTLQAVGGQAEPQPISQ